MSLATVARHRAPAGHQRQELYTKGILSEVLEPIMGPGAGNGRVREELSTLEVVGMGRWERIN